MKTDKITISDLFGNRWRYLVPIFQRGYVWNEEEQWEPLWEDIVDQAKLVQAHKESVRNTIRKHFLGSIVFSQVPAGIKDVPASEIIDGQQRLLTLQVFLTALRDATADTDDEFLKTGLVRMTNNPGPFLDPDEQFKVWPTNAYHEELRNIMDSTSPEMLEGKYPQRRYYGKLIPPRPKLVEAYLYFYKRIDGYLKDTEMEEEDAETEQKFDIVLCKERANILFEALMRHVQLVEIQLDAEDDPQVIFETLNYRGVPLEPSDLIRNYIFLDAGRQDKNIDSLYNQWWKDFDEVGEYQTKFWKEKERQGRLYRSRLDLFFFHYLTYRISHEIKMGHLYQEFKDWWSDSEKRSIEVELGVINRSSSDFRSFLEADDTNRLGVLAQRLRILDMTTAYPFMLWLCEHRHEVDIKEFNGILADLESYIVRRAICRLTPKNYNRIFLTLLTKLSKEGQPNRTSLRRELLALEGDSAVWPDDSTFKRNLIYEPLYYSLGPKRVRLVLTALELASRTSKQETLALPINNNLTIEHVMPRGYKLDEWPYPKQKSTDEEERESIRWAHLHSIGNLTLLTQPLNSEVSNGPFKAKRPEITKQSLLVLNSYFQKFSNKDSWNEKTILERGKRLTDPALKVWAYPRV